MHAPIGMQNILDESDERCGTAARMFARSAMHQLRRGREELSGTQHRMNASPTRSTSSDAGRPCLKA
jgi:hypothetical protein